MPATTTECAAPWCDADISHLVRPRGRPRTYCEDAACLRQRNRERKRHSRARNHLPKGWRGFPGGIFKPGDPLNGGSVPLDCDSIASMPPEIDLCRETAASGDGSAGCPGPLQRSLDELATAWLDAHERT